MNISRALWAGIIGCIVVVTVVRVAGWLTGGDADLCAIGGVALTGRQHALAWVVGAVAQLLIAGIAAFVYAAIFELVTRRATGLLGLAIAVPHVIVAGLAIGFLPVARLLDAGIGPPGAFMEYRGAWVITAFVLAHLAFGALVGKLYGKTKHTTSTVGYGWQDITARP